MTRMCNYFMFKNEISHFFIRMLHKITNKKYCIVQIAEEEMAFYKITQISFGGNCFLVSLIFVLYFQIHSTISRIVAQFCVYIHTSNNMRTRVCHSNDNVREVPSNVNPVVTSQYTDEIFALQHFLFHFPAGGGSIGGDRQHGGDEHQHCGGYPEVVGPACAKN